MAIRSIVLRTPLKNLHLFGAAKTRIRYSILNQDIHKASIMNRNIGSRHSASFSWCSAANSLAAAWAAMRTASASADDGRSKFASASVIFGAQPIPRERFNDIRHRRIQRAASVRTFDGADGQCKRREKDKRNADKGNDLDQRMATSPSCRRRWSYSCCFGSMRMFEKVPDFPSSIGKATFTERFSFLHIEKFHFFLHFFENMFLLLMIFVLTA